MRVVHANGHATGRRILHQVRQDISIADLNRVQAHAQRTFQRIFPTLFNFHQLPQTRGFFELTFISLAFTVGLLIASRGAGTILSMLIMIFFANSWNPRLLFLIGFGMHTYAGVEMARFEMNVSLSEVAWVMGLQGFGVGWLWVPMTLVTFSNLDPRRSAEGAALFHFARSVGSSYYISASVVVVFHTQKITNSELVQWINPYSAPLNLQNALGG